MNKKIRFLILLFSFLFFLAFSVGIRKSFSQQPVSWPDSNAIWITTELIKGYCHFPPMPNDIWQTWEHIYYLNNEDTVIGSKVYSKLYYKYSVTECHFDTGSFTNYYTYDFGYNGYYGGMRHDTAGKVFFLSKDSINENLLYDFSAKPGDTVFAMPGYFGSPFYIHWIDSILIGNKYHRQFTVSTLDPSDSIGTVTGCFGPLCWIEGIGGTGGLFTTYGDYCVCDYIWWPKCMSFNDTTYWDVYGPGTCDTNIIIGISEKAVNIFTVYPTPFSNILKINIGPNFYHSAMPLEIRIFDSLGRQQKLFSVFYQYEILLDLTDLSPGIYFLAIGNDSGSYLSGKIVKAP